ncbi:MAG: shikimate dehydrogenase [Bacteroidales bacterium]
MRKFGLIGYPLGHSFSKKYFESKFASGNIEGCSYELYPMPSVNHLLDFIKAEPELLGLNVTIPHKTSVIPLLDSVDPEAAVVGAVNVIKIRRSNSTVYLKGFNSDVYGIEHSLDSITAGSSCKALVLGTGGSSRAVVHVLTKLQIPFLMVSRRPGQGMLNYSDIDETIIDKHRLIINTTPLGMYPDINSCPELRYDLLSPSHTLFDLVYNPEMTMFLAKGKERGCTIINGLKMLHLQADKSWSIWNDENH